MLILLTYNQHQKHGHLQNEERKYNRIVQRHIVIRLSVGNVQNETATVTSIAARPRGRPMGDRLASRPWM